MPPNLMPSPSFWPNINGGDLRGGRRGRRRGGEGARDNFVGGEGGFFGDGEGNLSFVFFYPALDDGAIVFFDLGRGERRSLENCGKEGRK